MTRPAPLSRAIWPTIEPTAPAAPETNTQSPGTIVATSSSPTYAVNAVIPSTPRYAEIGTPVIGGTTRNAPASPWATSRHPSWCTTTSPTTTESAVEAVTRPTAPPVMTSPRA